MLRLLLGLFLGGGRNYRGRRRTGSFFSALKGRLFLALIIFGISYFSYKKNSRDEVNPITNEIQRVDMSIDQEISLGLKAAPRMEKYHKGKVISSNRLASLVEKVGNNLVKFNNLDSLTDYPYEFSLLADDKTVNAFALPGGKTYITLALLSKFDKGQVEDQLAGVMGHEIAHVIARHSNQQATKSKLTGGLSNAVGVLVGGNEYGGGNRQLAVLLNKVLNTRYSRGDELESDKLGLVFMYKAGYNPSAMVRVMEILHSASGGAKPPEFLSTHPSSENRIREIKRISSILKKYDRNESLKFLLNKIGY